jgi:ribonuclease J
MDKFQIFALGGLGENGKNMYVLNINRKFFIIDAGIKYPSASDYGCDGFIPDASVLKRYQNNIKGLFISNAHDINIGAIRHFIADVNIPIYATNFTLDVIKYQLTNFGVDITDIKFIPVKQGLISIFEDVRVSYFDTSLSVPESIGISFQTISGLVVFCSEFTFDQSTSDDRVTDFAKLKTLAEKNVLVLMVGSSGISKNLTGGTDELLDGHLSSIFNLAKKRIIVALYSLDVFNVQRIITLCYKTGRRVAFQSKTTNEMAKLLKRYNYLQINDSDIYSLPEMTDDNSNNDDNLVIVITGNRDEPFLKLQEFINGNEYVNLVKSDTVILMVPPQLGGELLATSTVDKLSRLGLNLEVIDKKLIKDYKATSDEVKMLVNLLKPKYVIPINGEYQYQYKVKQLLLNMGYDDSNVFLLDNGDSFYLEQKPYVAKEELTFEHDIYIDGTQISSGSEYVKRDRELLATNGILIVAVNVNDSDKKVIGEIAVIDSGVMFSKDRIEMTDLIKTVSKKIIEESFALELNVYGEMKRLIKRELEMIVATYNTRVPIVIPLINVF